MRPWTILGLLIVAGAAIVFGCSQEPRVHIEVDSDKPPETVRVADTPAGQPALLQDGDRIVKPSELPVVDLSVQEKYDAALLDALNQLADKKYTEALAALEAARALRDTEEVQVEIAKVQRLQQQQAAANKAAQDIQTV